MQVLRPNLQCSWIKGNHFKKLRRTFFGINGTRVQRLALLQRTNRHVPSQYVGNASALLSLRCPSCDSTTSFARCASLTKDPNPSFFFKKGFGRLFGVVGFVVCSLPLSFLFFGSSWGMVSSWY